MRKRSADWNYKYKMLVSDSNQSNPEAYYLLDMDLNLFSIYFINESRILFIKDGLNFIFDFPANLRMKHDTVCILNIDSICI